MQLVYVNYQVLPAFPDAGLADHWLAFVTPCGVGGVWLAYFLWQLGRIPVLPQHDPSQAEARFLHRRDGEEIVHAEEVHHG